MDKLTDTAKTATAGEGQADAKEPEAEKKTKAKKKGKDTQTDKYQITINHPLEKGWTHGKILETLTGRFKTLEYACMADELGTAYHTHVFVYFRSKVRFSMLKKYFPEAHIETCKGTVTDNIDYVKKEGKWEDSQKSETCVEGTFDEWGERPADSKGERYDMMELYRMIDSGMTNAEILAENQDYILQIDKLDKVRTTLLTERFKGKIRENMEVIYVSGVTGTGKTSGILKEHGCENIYRITDYQHPFDGYSCQSVLVFDEFRSSLRLKEMLNYCDIYPLELPARYSNKYACYEKVYIVSNWTLEKQYSELQREDTESWNAFLRRIHKVKVYQENGEITVYNSVRDYLNRDEGFHPAEKNIEIPFKED